jgi:site-specific DNA-methyltransferase (cytosine-N4-specific)
MTLCSPPYYSVKQYPVPDTVWWDGWHGQLGLEPTMDKYIDHLTAVACDVWRVLKPGGTFWLVIGDAYFNGRTGPIKNVQTIRGYARDEPQNSPRRVYPGQSGLKPKELMLLPSSVAFALRTLGWYVRGEIVWAKSNSMPHPTKDRPLQGHETIFLLTKQEKYYFDSQTGDPRRDVWSIPHDSFRRGSGQDTDDQRSHYAHFPLELAKRCIRHGSQEGDLVLDCFGGSGTTALAAWELGRRAVCLELATDYLRIAIDRLRVNADKDADQAAS